MVIAALAASGCAHAPWADDPSAEPPKVCPAIQPRPPVGGEPWAEAAVARSQVLYCEGLYASAAALLAEQAIGTPEAARALRWLVYIHRRFPGWEWIENVVVQADWSAFDRPEMADVRDDLHLLAGRYEYRSEQFVEALALLQTIPASSALHARAALLEGAIRVRTGAPDLAVAAFAEALRAASATKEIGVRDLAVLSLARASYAMGQFETASRHYESLGAASRYSIAAAREGSWARFQMNDLDGALARLETLLVRSRQVPPDALAEAMLLKATIALQRNRYRDAMEIINQFNEVYPVMFMQSRQLAGYEPGALFDIAFSVRGGGKLPPPLAAENTLLLLADVPIARRLDELDEMWREQLVVASLGRRWRYQFYEDAGLEQVDRKQDATREAGDLFRQRLQDLTDRLHDQLQEANAIEYNALQMQQAALRKLW